MFFSVLFCFVLKVRMTRSVGKKSDEKDNNKENDDKKGNGKKNDGKKNDAKKNGGKKNDAKNTNGKKQPNKKVTVSTKECSVVLSPLNMKKVRFGGAVCKTVRDVSPVGRLCPRNESSSDSSSSPRYRNHQSRGRQSSRHSSHKLSRHSSHKSSHHRRDRSRSHAARPRYRWNSRENRYYRYSSSSESEYSSSESDCYRSSHRSRSRSRNEYRPINSGRSSHSRRRSHSRRHNRPRHYSSSPSENEQPVPIPTTPKKKIVTAKKTPAKRTQKRSLSVSQAGPSQPKGILTG